MKHFLLSMLIVSMAACSSSESPQNLTAKVDALMAADDYETALSLLNDTEETEETLALKEVVHLNYGMFLEYRSQQEMRVRMNSAIVQFAEVLKINPDNEKAYSEIEQILGVYSTFPNRSPEPEAIEALREVGFEI